MIFLGLDAGSTGIKCVAFSENGVQLSLAYSEYPTSAGAGDMNADTIFDAAKDVIARCVSGGKVERSDVAAISVTSFGEACVPVDREGNCLCDMIMYTDRRGVSENERLIEKLGRKYISSVTCANPAPMYSLPKIMWMSENISAVRESAFRFLQAALSVIVCPENLRRRILRRAERMLSMLSVCGGHRSFWRQQGFAWNRCRIPYQTGL